MAEDVKIETPIEVGKLYRTTEAHHFINAPSVDFVDMEDWDFELLFVPKGSIIMPVKAITSSSKRHPYLKVFSLWNEQIIYTGDYWDTIVRLLAATESH